MPEARIDVGQGLLAAAHAFQEVAHMMLVGRRLPPDTSILFRLEYTGRVDQELRIRIRGVFGYDFASASVSVGYACIQIDCSISTVDRDAALFGAIAQAHVISREDSAGVFNQGLSGIRIGPSIFPKVHSSGGDSVTRQLSEDQIYEVDAMTHPLAEASA